MQEFSVLFITVRGTVRRHRLWRCPKESFSKTDRMGLIARAAKLQPAVLFRSALIFAIRDLPRWLFLAALIYAPWDYGGTSVPSTRRINMVLGVVVALWLVGLIVRRRRPQ